MRERAPLKVPTDERGPAIDALKLACEQGVAAVRAAKDRGNRKIPLGDSGYIGRSE